MLHIPRGRRGEGHRWGVPGTRTNVRRVYWYSEKTIEMIGEPPLLLRSDQSGRPQGLVGASPQELEEPADISLPRCRSHLSRNLFILSLSIRRYQLTELVSQFLQPSLLPRVGQPPPSHLLPRKAALIRQYHSILTVDPAGDRGPHRCLDHLMDCPDEFRQGGFGATGNTGKLLFQNSGIAPPNPRVGQENLCCVPVFPSPRPVAE